MRYVIPLALISLVVLGGCSTPQTLERPKGEFDAIYSASVSTAPVDMNAVPGVSDEGGNRQPVQIEVRVIDVDRGKCGELLARCPENLRALDGSARAFAVDHDNLSPLLDALRTREHAKIIGAPRITCLDRQRASLTLVSEHSYISGFEVTEGKGAAVSEPVMSIVRDGMVVVLRPQFAADRSNIALDVNLSVARLTDPMMQIKTSAPGVKGEFTLQVPLLKCERLRTHATLLDGNTLVLTGLQPEKSGRVLLVLINAKATENPR